MGLPNVMPRIQNSTQILGLCRNPGGLPLSYIFAVRFIRHLNLRQLFLEFGDVLRSVGRVIVSVECLISLRNPPSRFGRCAVIYFFSI